MGTRRKQGVDVEIPELFCGSDKKCDEEDPLRIHQPARMRESLEGRGAETMTSGWLERVILSNRGEKLGPWLGTISTRLAQLSC